MTDNAVLYAGYSRVSLTCWGLAVHENDADQLDSRANLDYVGLQ